MSMKLLRRRISSIVDRVDGKMGVAVQEVATGEEIGVAADDFFPMASVCKTPIIVEAYRQIDAKKIKLNQRVELKLSSRTSGSGLLKYFDTGLKPTVRDLLLLMIVVSDNAATDQVLSLLGGPGLVTQAMADLKLPHICLHRNIQDLIGSIYTAMDPSLEGLDYHQLEARFTDDKELEARFRDPALVQEGVRKATESQDVATPRDIARLYAMIARNECASPDSCAEILKTLERQQLRGRLPRELPPFTRFCHKTGTLGIGTVSNDSGLLFIGERAIAIAVLSQEVKQLPAQTNTAIARIGKIIYDHFAA